VRIDNLKAAILEANFYEPVYQRMYKGFVEHYGFKSIPCRIYHPNDKSKVESGIKYVKSNFFSGRTFTNGNDVDRQLMNWQEKAANNRITGQQKSYPKEVVNLSCKRGIAFSVHQYQIIKNIVVMEAMLCH